MDLDKQKTLIDHYFSMGRYRQALALLDKTQSAFPDDGYLHFKRALCLYNTDTLQQSAAHCNRALEAGYSPAACQRLMASIFMSKAKWEQARAWIDRSLSHQPEHPISLSMKALVLSQQGDHAFAAALMEKMISEHPDNENVLELGVLFYDRRKNGEWLKNENRKKALIDSLITLNPHSKIALNHLEKLYLVKNRIGKAKKVTAQKVSLYPEAHRGFSYRKVTPWLRLVFLLTRGIMRMHAIVSRLYGWIFSKKGFTAGLAIWIAASVWLGFPTGTAVVAGYFLFVPLVMLLFIAVIAMLQWMGIITKGTSTNRQTV